MEALSKVIALVMVAVLITLFPIQYLIGQQLTHLEGYVEHETEVLVNEIRDKECIDKEIYEGFLEKLSKTGVLYNIEIEHGVPKESADTASDLPGVLVVSSDIQGLSLSDDGDDMPDTRQIEEPKAEITSFATHTHTDACYDGHRHGETGCSRSGDVNKTSSLSFYKYFTNPAGNNYMLDIRCSNHGLIYKATYDDYNEDNGNYTGFNYDCIIVEEKKFNQSGQYTVSTTIYGRYLNSSTPQPGYFYYRNANGSGYRMQDPKWTTYVSQYDTFIRSYGNGVGMSGPPFNANTISGANINLPVDRKYLGCISCNAIIGPTVAIRGYQQYFGSSNWDTYRRNIIADSCGHYVGELTYNRSLSDSKTDPSYIQFIQYYNANNGVYTNYKRIYRYITSGTSQILNPEWNHYYELYSNSFLINSIYSGFNMPVLYEFGYKDKYSCYQCLFSGAYMGVLDNTVYSCASDEDTTPVCEQVVISIAATNPSQTVNKGGSIITTATATYLDGHTGIVNCTSNFNNQLPGTQTVTLTYTGLVGSAKTNGTVNCTMMVNVIDNSIPSSVTVVPSSYTVYNGSEPSYTVTVTYANGTSKIVTSGFTKTGWSSGVGVKTVTFTYTENGKTVSTSINITVKPRLIGISVTPIIQSVQRYTNPLFSVQANYENASYSSVLGYTLSGFNNTTLGMQNVTISYTEGGTTRSIGVTVNVTTMKRSCPDCGTEYELDANDFDPGCPVCKQSVVSIKAAPDFINVTQGDSLPITVTAIFRDGHTEAVTGWNSNYDPNTVGLQIVMVGYNGCYDFININVKSGTVCTICGTRYSLNEDGSNPGCPACKQALASITASLSSQTINQGEELSLTVYGVFRDGHSEPVTGWTTSFDNRRPGEQQVIVYYESMTSIVSVTVISEGEVRCGVCGNYYDQQANPWGCPVCRNTLVGLTAALITGGTKVAYGNEIELRVILTYRDGHRVMVFDGWTDNFNPYQMGVQTVAVSYEDMFHNTVSGSLSVEVVESLNEKVCANGHIYYGDEDDPCPYCETIVESKTQDLYNCTYTEEIIDKVYTDGIYRFNKGDYVTVRVKIRIKGSIYSFQFFGKKEDCAPISCGGEVS